MRDSRYFPDIDGCKVAAQLDHVRTKPAILLTIEPITKPGTIHEWWIAHESEQDAIDAMATLDEAALAVAVREAIAWAEECPW